MTDWNHDITKAPRGKYRVIAVGKAGQGARRVFERAEIVAASNCGVVCVTYWMDDETRWNMFTAGEQPIAWQPYSGRRQYTDDKGRTRYSDDLPQHPTMAESWFGVLLRERRAA